jgi:hypothetical protein
MDNARVRPLPIGWSWWRGGVDVLEKWGSLECWRSEYMHLNSLCASLLEARARTRALRSGAFAFPVLTASSEVFA